VQGSLSQTLPEPLSPRPLGRSPASTRLPAICQVHRSASGAVRRRFGNRPGPRSVTNSRPAGVRLRPARDVSDGASRLRCSRKPSPTLPNFALPTRLHSIVHVSHLEILRQFLNHQRPDGFEIHASAWRHYKPPGRSGRRGVRRPCAANCHLCIRIQG
jgi:hypothetical protein